MHQNVYTAENSKSTRCFDASWGTIIRGAHYKDLTKNFKGCENA